MRRVMALTLALSQSSALFTAAAHAQEAPSAPKPTRTVTPPEVRETVEATYPAEALEARLEAVVVLHLDIDAEGHVTDAVVVEPAGYGFDEASREAALRFRFTPATRNGRPIAARIRYTYSFALPPLPNEGLETTEAPISAATAPITEPSATPLTSASAPEHRSGAAASPPLEITVEGTRSEAELLQQSAEAINVIDTRKAKQRTADLGEVLARTQGVAVRRGGGLGSDARFSLNGLYDDQIRFFLDGVPLDFAGYPIGVVNVPVNLVDRIEVYRGVVPIRFGADALGGAVNLVSDQSYETHLGASYQVGSFGTHRATLDGRYRHEPSGLVFGGAAFVDVTQNNYDVQVEIAQPNGRRLPATVPRFHDAYSARGGVLEVGVVDRPWAKRILLQAFGSTYDKELQNNTVMSVPYGDVRYGEAVYGLTGRYELPISDGVDLDLVANYSHRTIDFVDEGAWLYDWYGRRVRPRRAGEIDSNATDQTTWQHSVFGRALLKWAPLPHHALSVSLTPTFVTRTGEERETDPDERDPLDAQRDLFTFVSGLEYESALLDERLANVAFVKSYVYRAKSEEVDTGTGVARRYDRDSTTEGFGDSLRYRFAPWVYAKASYEYATRLPSPDEVFGDGVIVHANLELEPETSHNANLGPRFELEDTGVGDFTIDVNAFYRKSDRLIVLLGNDRFLMYQNVYEALGVGLENAVSWRSPRRLLSLDGTLTYQDVRNASSEGAFGDFEGDRIPNRPYLFGSWGASLRFRGAAQEDDVVEPFYNGRYVHSFFRGWESLGLREYKQVIDSQVSHSAGVSWTVENQVGRVTSTFEVDNVTNAALFDNFGVQRPGRAFYVKVTGDI